MMLTAIAAIASVSAGRAAQQVARSGVVQHGAPAQHAAPVFHGTPVQRAAPAFRAAPAQPAFRGTLVQQMAPSMSRPTAPVHVMPTFPQQHNSSHFQAVNPNVQRINPNLSHNNPSALRPNLPLHNPNALRPNLPPSEAGALRPNFPPGETGALRPNLPPGETGALRPNLPPGEAGALRPNLPPSEAGALRPNPQLNSPAILRLNPNFVQRGGIAPEGPATLKPGPGQPPVNSALLKPSPGGSQHTRPAFPAVSLHNKFWPIHKDHKFMFIGGHRKLFVPVGLLGVALIGGSYWYPDGYVSMEGPACTGYTADGCQLQWRSVDFEEGGSEPQCVQYCPQVGPAPALAQAAALPPPLPLAENGACQATIYAEPNFGGNSAPTGDSQPNLSQTGWRNEISSLVVGAGTWEFFTDENFGGESMRLPPGTYPTLSAEWTRHIGSFMCVQPGPPPA